MNRLGAGSFIAHAGGKGCGNFSCYGPKLLPLSSSSFSFNSWRGGGAKDCMHGHGALPYGSSQLPNLTIMPWPTDPGIIVDNSHAKCIIVSYCIILSLPA